MMTYVKVVVANIFFIVPHKPSFVNTLHIFVSKYINNSHLTKDFYEKKRNILTNPFSKLLFRAIMLIDI